MANQPLLSPDASGLDSGAWNRLGAIAGAAQSTLAQTHAPETPVTDPPKGPGLFGALLTETLATLQRDWHRLFHPLESIREWWASQTQAQASYQDQGSTRAASPDKPTPPDQGPGRGPTLEATWTSVRDQLFEAAKDSKADPQHVADRIVASIPTEHRVAVAERLGWLAEMAQTTAKSLQTVETQTAERSPERAPLGEPAHEPKREPPLPSKIRPLKSYPERQVPKQPLPPTPTVTRPAPPTPAPPTHAKAR